jgi:hypothetical protein
LSFTTYLSFILSFTTYLSFILSFTTYFTYQFALVDSHINNAWYVVNVQDEIIICKERMGWLNVYLPIVLPVISDGQGSGTTVDIPTNGKAKSSNIENMQLNSNERQNSLPQQHELFHWQISNCWILKFKH